MYTQKAETEARHIADCSRALNYTKQVVLMVFRTNKHIECHFVEKDLINSYKEVKGYMFTIENPIYMEDAIDLLEVPF